MAKITFTLTAQATPRVINALSEQYEPQIIDENGDVVDNPQTKVEFAREQLKRLVALKVKRYEERVAREALPAGEDLDVTVS